MANYLDPKTISRAEALGLKARAVVEGLRVGDHKSPFRGFSVEFVQHREYVPGDDTRHIDWKSYARSERYTIKQYEQETNYAAHVMLDSSLSMRYGEGEANKLEYAKLLTATLAYVVIRQRDSMALNVFDNAWREQLQASSNMTQITTLLHTLDALKPREKTDMGPLLEQLADRVRRRGLIFIISDCFDDVESVLKGLRHLRFQGHDVTLFHVMHPDEIDFPFTGNTKFDGLEIPEEIKTRPHLIRPAYLKAVQSYLEQLQKGCDAFRVDYVRLNTTTPLTEALTPYLVRRLQMGRL
ncbi:DUF58 domain-containing protein [Zavarzinella formosa]|uniref:DUF58 domain-containing protein n=1 Tax=Zavarzinella formosa TaxID=360055 RepID=UPI00030E3616|nr:DUF58 domain-containing protein [Zavarzinella formosa]